MSSSAKISRSGSLLLVAAILASSTTEIQGQHTAFGGCKEYQSHPEFTATFNETLIAETGGYNVLMTSDRESNAGCYLFTFKEDQKFELTYKDNNYEEQMSEGRFVLEPKSYYGPGYIDLGLPGLVLGGGLFGGARFHVIYVSADGSLFVILSCSSSGLLHTEHVHVLAKTSQMSALSPMIATINTTLQEEGIPHAENFRQVDQTCTAPTTINGGSSAAGIVALLEKLGVSCPTARGLLAQYRSSLPQPSQTSGGSIPQSLPDNATPLLPYQPISPQPTHVFSSLNGVPVQVMAHPGSVSPISTGQVQPYYVYNPAVQSIFQQLQSGLAASVNGPVSFGHQNAIPGLPYYTSSPVITRESNVVQHPLSLPFYFNKLTKK